MQIIRETQKRTFKGKIIDYPVSQIQILDDHTFFIKCRDPKNADTFKAITTAYENTSHLALSEERNYELLKVSPTEFVLRGKDAQLVLEDFSGTALLSNTLLIQVLDIANAKKLSCVIS